MNGIIVFNSNPCNIGDYIQSLAASKFFSEVDYYINRENVSNFHGKEQTKVIMNAWWMWSKNWPPSIDIIPLYQSFHINPTAAKWILNINGVQHLRKYSPIGCRDIEMYNLLQEKGINSYFSGCLTLTLGKKGNYITTEKSNEIIICDPYYNINIKSLIWGKCNIISLILLYIKKRDFFHKIRNSFGYKHKMFNIKNKILKKVGFNLQLAYFYQSYTTLFTKELIEHAHYTAQWIKNRNKTHQELLEEADILVKRYAKAKLIITSRIHCALPSIGCETPVLFVMAKELISKNQTPVGGRLSGLSDFFHTITYTSSNKLVYNNSSFKTDRIGEDFKLKNKDTYLKYRDKLIEECTKFANS